MSTDREIKKEELLLLRLCRLEFSQAQNEEISSLVQSIHDWNYFITLANAHGVIALACHNLGKLNLSDAVPADISSALRSSLMKSLSRNEFNTRITTEALRLLNRAQIRVILLKGMALELSVYGNQGLRQMSDVDVLIDRKKCIKARKLLMDNGFKSLPVKSVIHKIIIKNLGKHLPSLEKNGALFEIHYELFGKEKNGLTSLFMEKSSVTLLQDENVSVPYPQLLFLYLVRHLWLHEKNNESQLRLYTDLVVLTEKYSEKIFNHEFTGLAVKAKMEEVLATRLMIMKHNWKIVFPSFIDDFIAAWHDPDFISKFYFFLKSPKGNPPTDKAWSYRQKLSEIPGLHRKLIFLAGDLFPTLSFMATRYKCSRWKAVLYYPHRFGKLFYLLKR